MQSRLKPQGCRNRRARRAQVDAVRGAVPDMLCRSTHADHGWPFHGQMWPRSLWTLCKWTSSNKYNMRSTWINMATLAAYVRGTKRALAAHATGYPAKSASLGLQCDALWSLAAIQYTCLALGFFKSVLSDLYPVPSHFWRSVCLQAVALHQSAFAAQRGNRSSLASLAVQELRIDERRNLLHSEKLNQTKFNTSCSQVSHSQGKHRQGQGKDKDMVPHRIAIQAIQAIKTQ